jgi:glutamate synthase (NADPH/NADH) small chain
VTASLNPLKPPARVKIPRQHPLEEPAGERSRTFGEVSHGFDEERARLEASRCLECRDAACTRGCPVGVDIRSFVQLVYARDYAAAARKIREENALPAICGRVCPQETQCEATCTVGRKFAPIAIGLLERFVADRETADGSFETAAPAARRKERVAVVGSGPAGLTCAADLARLGYGVTVFEALHAAGGVLRYGIPEFRLPKAILDLELRRVEALGVEIRTNVLVGRTVSLDELMGACGYDAVFLGTGAGTPTFLGVPGEGLVGVYSANEFLTRVNLMGAWRHPEAETPVLAGRSVVVVGGGNTAMDAVRTARRLGAERATLVYRRSRAEMPARAEEIAHAEQEGIELLLLAAPTRILGDETGRVRGVEIQAMALGAPDASGRPRPEPVAGSERVLAADVVIEAVGQKPNPVVQSTTPDLVTARGGVVVVDGVQKTSRDGVYAGGDLARGGATVILAMRDGRVAARAIHGYLQQRRAPSAAAEERRASC